MKDCPTVPFIGLSATPWSRGLGRFYDDLIVAARTDDLIREGFLSDFVAYAPLKRGYALDIPFAALIRTHVEMPSADRQAVTAFARYSGQMTPGTNILNRTGLFAFKAQERRLRGEVSRENWRTFADEKRALRAAQIAI